MLFLAPLAVMVIAALAPADQPAATPPKPAEAAAPETPGPEAYRAAADHLAAGRLSLAAHFFDQAARHGHRRPDALQGLAYVQYLQDNVAGGDATLALAHPDGPGDWAAAAARERTAATQRLAALLDETVVTPAPRPKVERTALD